MSRPGAVTVRAPAKVNLELRVGTPREDGYHELATVFQAISLFDDVTVTPLEDAEPGTVEVGLSGENTDGVPADESNLAVRAVRLLTEQTGIDEAVRIDVRKHIPVAAGMAGGSADAAAALLACDVLWQIGLGRDGLHDMAAELGSDVPFPLLGGTAVGTGRGEQLTPALVRGEYLWVVAAHSRSLSTPAVFAEIDRLRKGKVLAVPTVSQDLMQALGAGNPAALGAHLANDLQPAACSLLPDLLRVLEAGDTCDALGSVVSGSGPTVAFLARDGEHALDIAASVRGVDTVAAVHQVSGPAHGVRVVSVQPQS